jgi:hypothetical protein
VTNVAQARREFAYQFDKALHSLATSIPVAENATALHARLIAHSPQDTWETGIRAPVLNVTGLESRIACITPRESLLGEYPRDISSFLTERCPLVPTCFLHRSRK